MLPFPAERAATLRDDSQPMRQTEPSEMLPDALIGQTLKGTYRVRGKLAEGGMGAVYEGEHVRLGRKVAIKIMLAKFAADPDAIARFRREAQIVGQLEHPHVVQVFDVDETEAGDPYLVMEFLHGETLGARLEREHRLPLTAVLPLISKLASALAGAHEHGIVHRDLKPENVFLVELSEEPEFPKILDFGVSKIRNAPRRITADDAPIGTPSYMAPEQVTSPHSVDARADQFALATLTFEMLSGELPFTGETAREILAAIVCDPPRKLSELMPGLYRRIDEVLERALSKDRALRYASVSEFVRAVSIAAEQADPAAVQTGSRPHSKKLERAQRLIDDARLAFDRRELDDAVFAAEKLLDLAAHHVDAAIDELVSAELPALDEIFAARVGPRARRLRTGPADPRRMSLTLRAESLCALAKSGTTVGGLLADCSLPEPDAIRLLAGLLRRGALELA